MRFDNGWRQQRQALFLWDVLPWHLEPELVLALGVERRSAVAVVPQAMQNVAGVELILRGKFSHQFSKPGGIGD
jgi:hypothetical protein